MAGRSRAVLITLTIKRRRKLEQVIAAGTSPQRLVLRAKIVLAAAAGTANAAIARDLGCSVAVVRTWRCRVRGPRDTGPVRQAPLRAAGSAWAQREAGGHRRGHLRPA
jgi:hypothetical protein